MYLRLKKGWCLLSNGMTPNRSCLPRLKGTKSGYLSRVPLRIHSIVNAPLKHVVGGSFGVDPSWICHAERQALSLPLPHFGKCSSRGWIILASTKFCSRPAGKWIPNQRCSVRCRTPILGSPLFIIWSKYLSHEFLLLLPFPEILHPRDSAASSSLRFIQILIISSASP